MARNVCNIVFCFRQTHSINRSCFVFDRHILDRSCIFDRHMMLDRSYCAFDRRIIVLCLSIHWHQTHPTPFSHGPVRRQRTGSYAVSVENLPNPVWVLQWVSVALLRFPTSSFGEYRLYQDHSVGPYTRHRIGTHASVGYIG
jgi:hypothetical protein